MSQDAPKILMVDDDPQDYSLFHTIARKMPYSVNFTQNEFEALSSINQVKPNLLILDDHLPHMSGLEFYDHLRIYNMLEDVSTIMISDSVPESELLRRGIIHIGRPVDLINLLLTIEALMAPVLMRGERRLQRS